MLVNSESNLMPTNILNIPSIKRVKKTLRLLMRLLHLLKRSWKSISLDVNLFIHTELKKTVTNLLPEVIFVHASTSFRTVLTLIHTDTFM